MADHSSAVRGELYPEIEPYRAGLLDLDHVCTRCIGKNAATRAACRSSFCMAVRAPDRRRPTAASSIPRITASSFTISAAPGRSRPLGELRDNTTPLLVEDLERLRRYLGIERWLVFGGSWGSTLALAYAIAHPERCTGLILRGIFLCRKSEIEWFLYGLRNLFPEAWASFASAIPRAERGDLLAAYYRRLTDPDPAVHMPAARAWSIYEGSCSTLLASPETVAYFAGDVVALGLARIEAHYFTHDIFMPENALLANISRIRSVPGVIVQGRYDAVCPIVTADDLHRAWPEADYIIVPDAGHSAWEPPICAELVKATERFKPR